MIKKITLLLLFVVFQGYTQEKPIKIVEERQANRLMLFAVNENLQDFDVLITVEGRNFRQSKGRPRMVRVPATSKVHLKNLIVERGKVPQYTYELDVRDSLSRRALRKEFELIKVDPKKAITVYLPENCTNCDSIIDPLNKSHFKYRSIKLGENPTVKEQLGKAFIGATTPLDSIRTFIVSLGGSIYIRMKTYDELLEELDKE